MHLELIDKMEKEHKISIITIHDIFNVIVLSFISIVNTIYLLLVLITINKQITNLVFPVILYSFIGYIIIDSLLIYNYPSCVICFIKATKREVNYIMEKVFLFYRFNYSGTNNLHCHWGVVFHTLDDELPMIHILSDTCNRCGDYINSLYNTDITLHKPRRIMCKCHG